MIAQTRKQFALSPSFFFSPSPPLPSPMPPLTDERRAAVGASIRAIPDFPKKGILFQDVTTLLLDPKVREGRREKRGAAN